MHAEYPKETSEQDGAWLLNQYRNIKSALRERLGKVAATGLLILAGSSITYGTQEGINPEWAYADTVSLEFSSEYPHLGAQAYDTANYE